MRRINLALLVLCVTFLWVETAQAAQRYVDNHDGTITDTVTGLMWEKKTTDGSVHDVRNLYSWSTTETKPDGTAFVVFLGTLNHNSTDPNTGDTIAKCFANHCDWRLPTSAELIGIFDPAVKGCGVKVICTDPLFGPMPIQPYWSSTTEEELNSLETFDAWFVSFQGIVVDGEIAPEKFGYAKIWPLHARAVRGGS